ncbi:uncharacterized protein (UPF0332 family) [Larkinella arboricola]|uniref:Uncharacterized protein (UPF0332 family) n=1 Tax=Larkinella arboricola TaxID=643671 RepID=A0A327X653_LARAB|nr:HEPN domain-containing protein [Larkinella arboricola]RAK02149.1 uncharacterized protein (UPF0332 family) [Larkinella arboricola]
MSEDLKQYLRKAQDYLTIAKNALHSELPIGAITPSYYCFFWLVRGLLYEKGIVTKRHSGAREMFSLHYIKTGEIPQSFSNDFGLLFDRRQIADYDLEGDFPKDEIERLVDIAENFLIYVKEKYP